MHIDTLNPTHPWGSHLTAGSSPASIGFDDFTDYGTDQALACQYDIEEQLFSLDSCFDSVFESQPDFSSPYELPDLSQRAVSPSMTSLDRTFSSEVAGYDFSTAHTFASPIWPSDENEHPRSFFKLSGVAKDVDNPSKWGPLDDLESHGPKLSQTGRAGGGTTEKVPCLQKSPRRSRRRNKGKSGIEPLRTLQRNIHRCEFPGCSWTFRRNEHLKRHMKTLHREAPESFFCEFCGKNGFSRRDNLKTHRKLHARQPSRKCRVEFVPGAALIVQQEMHSRNLRLKLPSARSRFRPRPTCTA
ncbi:hypothetical protein IWW34DRAFT_710909 [Fusarium oxysporum f. sp. albedinis]|nr:hypothetical protein IWW34DRAFT_710909 [Fusarium oxysporum f. sp. albedinis]KAJ0133590.1 Uncharacterized protein HZ326_23358 [Fusarium oxysporum f. sp. albedinis]